MQPSKKVPRSSCSEKKGVRSIGLEDRCKQLGSSTSTYRWLVYGCALEPGVTLMLPALLFKVEGAALVKGSEEDPEHTDNAGMLLA